MPADALTSARGALYRVGRPEVLRASNTGLLVLALVVGAGSAGFAILFRWLIKTFTHLATGQADYAATPGAQAVTGRHLACSCAL